MTSVVRPCISVRSAAWTCTSDSASSALVASSSSRIGASFRKARASETRWRSPPDSRCRPGRRACRSPPAAPMMKSCAAAARAAASISSSRGARPPEARYSAARCRRTAPTSWLTTATAGAQARERHVADVLPVDQHAARVASKRRGTSDSSVDLPEPGAADERRRPAGRHDEVDAVQRRRGRSR